MDRARSAQVMEERKATQKTKVGGETYVGKRSSRPPCCGSTVESVLKSVRCGPTEGR